MEQVPELPEEFVTPGGTNAHTPRPGMQHPLFEQARQFDELPILVPMNPKLGAKLP
jgi:hypothetical protein